MYIDWSSWHVIHAMILSTYLSISILYISSTLRLTSSNCCLWVVEWSVLSVQGSWPFLIVWLNPWQVNMMIVMYSPHGYWYSLFSFLGMLLLTNAASILSTWGSFYMNYASRWGVFAGSGFVTTSKMVLHLPLSPSLLFLFVPLLCFCSVGSVGGWGHVLGLACQMHLIILPINLLI